MRIFFPAQPKNILVLLWKKNAHTENGLSTTHELENICFSTVSADVKYAHQKNKDASMKQFLPFEKMQKKCFWRQRSTQPVTSTNRKKCSIIAERTEYYSELEYYHAYGPTSRCAGFSHPRRNSDRK